MSRLSSWTKYWARTNKILRQNVYDTVHMTGTLAPSRAPRTLFTFNDSESVQDWKKGSDSDIGGTSTVNFDLDTSPKYNAAIGKPATGVFWGQMSLAVKPGLQGKVRGGYAAIQNKRRPTLFGEMLEEIEYHDYLALRVRAGGDPKTWGAYFVNVQTEGDVQADIWQHRLFFRRKDGGWEDIFIPFSNFVRTNHGQIAKKPEMMNKRPLRSVNIALLGGHSDIEGKYELGLDSIRVVNEEDVKEPPSEKKDNVNWEDLPGQKTIEVPLH